MKFGEQARAELYKALKAVVKSMNLLLRVLGNHGRDGVSFVL